MANEASPHTTPQHSVRCHIFPTAQCEMSHCPLVQCEGSPVPQGKFERLTHPLGTVSEAHRVLRGSVRASTLTVQLNCQISPAMCGQLNPTLLHIDVSSLYISQLLNNMKMYTVQFSLHQKTKKQGRNNCNKRGKLFERGTLNSWSSLSSCTRQMIPALVFTCLKYMLQCSQESKDHDWGKVHSCKACMCDMELFACYLECSNVVYIGHTPQWKMQQCGLYDIYVKPVVKIAYM